MGVMLGVMLMDIELAVYQADSLCLGCWDKEDAR